MVGRIQILLTLLTTSAAVGGVVLPAETGPQLDGPDAPESPPEDTPDRPQPPDRPVDSPPDRPDAPDEPTDSPPDDANQTDANQSDSNGSEESTDSTADTEVDSGEVDRDRASNVRVDDTVVLVDYQWDADAEVFRLTFESNRPRQVTITESVQQPKGAGTFEIRKERLQDGLTELAIPAEPSGGEVAVSITTPASVRQGSGVYVSTGVSEAEGGPWSTTSSEAGWFGGLSVALTMLVGAAWQAKRRDYDSPEGYE